MFLLDSFIQSRVKFEALWRQGKCGIISLFLVLLSLPLCSFTVVGTCNLVSWILTCTLKSQGLRRCIEIKGLRGIVHWTVEWAE